MVNWDDFKKLRELGEGGFGAAYLVEKKSDQTKHVIKVVNVRSASPGDLKYAEQEAVTLQSLTHTNIIKYGDAWFNADKTEFCILMEYCDSGDLFQHIRIGFLFVLLLSLSTYNPC